MATVNHIAETAASYRIFPQAIAAAAPHPSRRMRSVHVHLVRNLVRIVHFTACVCRHVRRYSENCSKGYMLHGGLVEAEVEVGRRDLGK